MTFKNQLQICDLVPRANNCNVWFFFFCLFSCRLLCSVSPSGMLQAQLRNVPGSKGKEDKQFLEVKMSRTWLNKMISKKDEIFLFNI